MTPSPQARHHSPTGPLRVSFVFIVAAFLAMGAAPIGPQQIAKHDDNDVRPLLARHCVECHGAEKPKGNLRLDAGSADFSTEKQRQKWQKVLDRVKAGEMPPEEKPRLSEKEIQSLVDWISGSIKTAESAQRAAQGRIVLRRLNRTEYENTVRDLLGIKANLKEQLPQDGTANGFDNAAAAQHTSSFLMERYLEAADTALNMAIANRPQPKMASNRYTLKDSHTVKLSTEKVYRHLEDSVVVCFCSSHWHIVGPTPFYPSERGNYRFRISASGFQSGGKPVTFRVTTGGTQLQGKSGLIGYFDAPPDEPKVFEFVRYMEPRTSIGILPYGLANSGTVHKIGADVYEGRGLAVQSIEIEGPIHDVWPPESHRRIFGDLPQAKALTDNYGDRVEVTSKAPLVDAEQVLRKFARRAFRRAVTDDDLQPFINIVKIKMEDNYTFEQAIRAALKGVMLSPDFLFLREKPGKLDDFALASRLSYFLWSTMPDEELTALAEQKKLNQPEVLRGQVERMLADPKAIAFTENFVGQWLGLRDIDFTEPSHLLYPEYDHMLKVSMIQETEMFFNELLKNNLSLTNFVASDFTMLNGRLAKHYGIPGPDGWEFDKVSLPPGSHRGGLLTMASVMKVTANGTTTSPVVRGAWVLDRILGTPPSPPPEDVAALDPDTRGATTIREQLAKHRTIASCASCHTKIDPPGFALESFDCIGGWRDHYRSTGNGQPVMIDGRRMPYLTGKKIDPSDIMPDGQRFANVDEFKQILLQDNDQLARSLTIKLLTYATGGAPTNADRPEIEAIIKRLQDKNYGLRSLVHEVAQSEVFRNK